MKENFSNIKLPPLHGEPKPWHERWPARTARVTGGLAAAAMALVCVDSLATSVLEPKVASSTIRVSGEEQCKEADNMTVVLSSTGLPVAHYAAGHLAPTVEQHNGCVVAQAYGTSYRPVELAKEIAEVSQQFTTEGQVKELVVVGLSFGGMAAQDIVNVPAVKEANHLRTKAIIIESGPSGPESVKGNFSHALLWLSKYFLPPGKAALLVVNTASMADQGRDLRSERTVEDIIINTERTSTNLVGDQLRRITQQYAAGNNTVPVFYIGSANDKVVDTLVASEEINERLAVPMAYFPLPSSNDAKNSNHASSWIDTDFARYEQAYKKIYERLFPPVKAEDIIVPGRQQAR